MPFRMYLSTGSMLMATPCETHGPAEFAQREELEHIHAHVEIIEQLLRDILQLLEGLPGPPF